MHHLNLIIIIIVFGKEYKLLHVVSDTGNSSFEKGVRRLNKFRTMLCINIVAGPS
jgi:hypothetical protein